MMNVNVVGRTENEKLIIQWLFDEYVSIMKKDLGDTELTICNEPLRPYPLTAPKRLNVGQREDCIIYLCHKPEYWCQMIYQTAHELGHFFMDCYPEDKKFKWISECLCELFSIIFLARSISFFQMFSPIYVNGVTEYIKDYMRDAQSYSTLSCSELIASKVAELENDPTEDSIKGRPRNTYIATKLFEQLGCDGKGLSAVCLFKDLTVVKSNKEFFDLWLQKCRNEDEIEFVSTLRNELGL